MNGVEPSPERNEPIRDAGGSASGGSESKAFPAGPNCYLISFVNHLHWLARARLHASGGPAELELEPMGLENSGKFRETVQTVTKCGACNQHRQLLDDMRVSLCGYIAADSMQRELDTTGCIV
jgi:hypothetical protein